MSYFRMIEMQAMLVAFVETFKFSLPDEEYKINRAPVAIMAPLLDGEESRGVQMPLKLEVVGELE